jgi:hypothetical protein
MNPAQELATAKRKLYHLLLLKPVDKLTATEVDIGYALVKDKDIQVCFDEMKKALRKTKED